MPVIIVLLCFMITGALDAQTRKSKIRNENIVYRKKVNEEFKDTTETPLTKAGLKVFKKVSYFPIKTKYHIVAKLTLTPDEKPFEMPRSKGNTGTYRKYGVATFVLNGKKCSLSVYQYMKLINDEQYKNDLFLPFKDLSNGKQTYEGGRFLELKISGENELIIDFNQAFNPLCCYHNPKFSCPIPPEENHLKIKILAGEKKYTGKD
jgi:uncharacterized protein